MMLGSVKKPVVGVTLTPDKKRYTEFVGWKKGTKTSQLRVRPHKSIFQNIPEERLLSFEAVVFDARGPALQSHLSEQHPDHEKILTKLERWH